MNKFKVGDVVVLKSSTQEPKMTIKLIDEDTVECVYFKTQEYHFEAVRFKIDTIQLYKQDENTQPIYLG